MKPLLVIGDALLDRDIEGVVERDCPDAPAPVLDEQESISRPGGAALAAALAAADGRPVTLITALADDRPGRELAGLLEGHSVEVLDVGVAGATPEKIRVRDRGRTLLRIDRGEPGQRIGSLTAAARAAIGWAETILVSDYGRGLSEQRAIRDALTFAAPRKTVIWDPHPRGAAPVRCLALATPNRAEARAFATDLASGNGDGDGAASWGRRLAADWHARHVCVTCAADGAVLSGGERSLAVPAPRVCAGDSCGAGDRFAAAAAGALADGSTTIDAVREGVESASSFVALGGASGWAARMQAAGSRPGSRPETHPGRRALSAGALATAVHAQGGTLVATGGCFDLLHTGHITTLQTAGTLGDCLIVCLNSDASVSRLKGPSRPLVAQADRVRVLEALSCVDAVAVFDEDSPGRVLRELRPDVWVKGGDYERRELPEGEIVEGWGGRVVTLPYVDGHSTSRLLREVVGRGGS